MNENLVIALEASWELDPVLLEEKLWDTVEKVSKHDAETAQSSGVPEFKI